MPANAVRTVRSRWQRLDAAVQDAVLAAGLTILAFLPVLSAVTAEIGDLPGRPIDALGVALTLAQCVPLAIRTRWPSACLGIVGAGFAVHQAMSYPATFGTLGLYLAVYAASAYQQRSRGLLAAAGAAGYAVLAVTLHNLGSPNRLGDFVLFFLVLVVIWMAGSGMRRWRRDETERLRLGAEMATAVERARIARELHDVVTHHVTAMVVQADAAQFLLAGAPAKAGDGLAAISGTGRRALSELRHLLDVLEATGESPATDRSPTLGRIGDLVEQARLTGQPVELTEQGEPRSPTVEAELAAYRVVQEGLTNATRHATGRPTTVRVRHGQAVIEIEVITEGPATTPAGPSGGRGLNGLRERLRLLGGELAAGPRPDGGFDLLAVIPAGSDT